MGTDSGILDEAYERFATTGPEFSDGLSNHGPMASEAMVRHGRDGEVHAWVDTYMKRLEVRPTSSDRIKETDWRDALGDMSRAGDWLTYFERATTEQPWRDVLVAWWPRLLPGIAAGATHGVIRVGHALRALHESETRGRVAELAQGLGYWAARWQPIPNLSTPTSGNAPQDALDGVPLVPSQLGGISDRLAQLADVPDWRTAIESGPVAATPEMAKDHLTALVAAATWNYLGRGHGNGIMMVHSVTAPNAVLRAFDALPRDLWVESWNAAWSASAAVTAAYAAPAGDVEPSGFEGVEDVMSRAVAHGDEHVIKLTDTALDVYDRTHDPRATNAAIRSMDLIGRH